MSIIQERPRTTITCPPWCDGGGKYHPDIEGKVIHSHAVGSLGVAVEEHDRGPVVYFPELPIDDMMAPADYARKLAGDLIAAAEVIEAGEPSSKLDEGCRAGTAAVFEWPTPAWATETEHMPAFDADAWHTRAIKDGDLLVCLEQSDKIEVSEGRARIVRSAAQVTVDPQNGKPVETLTIAEARAYALGSGVGAASVAGLLAAYDGAAA